MKDLSIIVISYNTRQTTLKALAAIQKNLQNSPTLRYELIVIDNGSTDGSVEALKQYAALSSQGSLKRIYNAQNRGFGAANNQGMRRAEGRFVLLMNSDVIVESVDFAKLMQYMDQHPSIGVLTVKILLNKHRIDPASHRGFPTVWRSFCYFTHLESLTRHIPLLKKVCGGYHLTDKNLSTIHEIDSPTAAFYLTRKEILDAVDGFDETYFMYGEDLDLSFRIKRLGYKIIYYPFYTVIHLKHQSGLKNRKKKAQKATTYHFYNAMRIFYDTHYSKQHPWVVNLFVHKAIDVKYWLASL